MKKSLLLGLTVGVAVAGSLLIQPHVAEPDAVGASDERVPRTVSDRDMEGPPKRIARREEREEHKDKKEAPKPKKRRTLEVGMKGADVRKVQRSLARATYDPGAPDGSFGYMTLHAVLAFEKVKGLERDGIITPKEQKMIASASAPRPPLRDAAAYVDVDITRQVLFEVRDGKVVHTLPVSTANGETYQSHSGLATAYTPRGEYTIYSKTAGVRTSYLGSLYSPSYFTGGYAIHGSSSVPPYPASHGCVRIPMHSTDEFFARNPVGTPVYVHD